MPGAVPRHLFPIFFFVEEIKYPTAPDVFRGVTELLEALTDSTIRLRVQGEVHGRVVLQLL